MKVFAIADTHFGHRALVDRHAERPDDFEATIVRNWEKVGTQY